MKKLLDLGSKTPGFICSLYLILMPFIPDFRISSQRSSRQPYIASGRERTYQSIMQQFPIANCCISTHRTLSILTDGFCRRCSHPPSTYPPTSSSRKIMSRVRCRFDAYHRDGGGIGPSVVRRLFLMMERGN